MSTIANSQNANNSHNEFQKAIEESDTDVVCHLDNNGTLRICINRPKLHNAFNDHVIGLLIAAFDVAATDDQVRVVILQSEGKNFSAGADLNWMKGMAQLNLEDNRQDAAELARLMHVIYTCPKPVIARIQGASFGGALGLIACSDIAVATSNARFCLSEVKIGLVPAVISPYVSKAIGARAAQRYFITAEQFNADKALQLGLLHEVVNDESLDDVVNTIAETLVANGPQAVAAAKTLAHYVSDNAINDKTITYTTDLIAKIRVSSEGQEGLSAFLEKRKANWNKG